MQAIILLRVPGDPVAAEQVLSGLRFDTDFMRDNHCVVESITVAFGTSHFVAVIAAATTEEVFRGLRAIRKKLDEMVPKSKSDPCTSTSTLLGWDPESEVNFSRVLQRACAQACQQTEAFISLSEEGFDAIMGRLALEEYIRERLTSIRKLLNALTVEQSAAKDKRIVDAIDGYLGS